MLRRSCKMKHMMKALGIFIFFVILPAAYSASQDVTIEINYGGIQQNRETKTTWKPGITALESLQSVAKVETRKIGDYLLVVSIDGVEGKRGEMAWYYDLNGKHATSVASKYVLQEGDHLKWIYTKDVCSPKAAGESCK
ncbi:MAG: DUF4430 domain-containing protein [Candidatus Brocadia sp. BL1]|nr:DUF4430 domain-containing protein [Candidatus Brocadia sp.]TVL96037.1 MAG: DUF4430 domain-containing protein [Candidatus Brocadia sp. BL1]